MAGAELDLWDLVLARCPPLIQRQTGRTHHSRWCRFRWEMGAGTSLSAVAVSVDKSLRVRREQDSGLQQGAVLQSANQGYLIISISTR